MVLCGIGPPVVVACKKTLRRVGGDAAICLSEGLRRSGVGGNVDAGCAVGSASQLGDFVLVDRGVLGNPALIMREPLGTDRPA